MTADLHPWNTKPDAEYSTAGGKILIWYPQPHVVCTRISGRFEYEFAEKLMARFDDIMAKGMKPLVCHDWGDVTSYEVKVQADFTTWAIKRSGRIEAVMIYADSPLLRVGIKVSNVAVGGIMRVYDARSKLQAALANMLEHSQAPRAKTAP